jgi:hypothetical protein
LVVKRTKVILWSAAISALAFLLGGIWLVSATLFAAAGECGQPGDPLAGNLLVVGILMFLLGAIVILGLMVYTVRYLRKQHPLE